ncbi:MAG: penicillin-binding transpeptidase domain-containing protein, partial [Longimicrobiales bacterium]
AQRAAEKELEAQLKRLDGRVRKGAGELQGSVVMMEAQTGDVLALVGGRDPTTSRYNRAVLGRRQIGSAFKPFVFAAALQDGIPTSQLVLDAPLRMELSRNDVWEPENYDGRYEGNVSLRRALVRSRNVPTIRLATAVGIDHVASTARQAGITATMDETPSLALGTVAMSPLQLATAYTTFATLGSTTKPRYVQRVMDENGKVLWETTPQPARTGLNAGVAYIITDILRDAVDYGTGSGVRTAGFRGPVAGKTGTTNNATDAWFVGYTPEVVGAVWIGYDTPSPLGSAATGGGFAAPVFGRIMRQYYTGRAVPEWDMPAGVLEYRIDPYTGLVLQDGCQPNGTYAEPELFLRDHLPPVDCPYRDWWGDFWGRVGGIFGEDDDDDRPRRERDIDNRRERELEREMGRESRRREDELRARERAMEEFLRERSERLRRETRGRGNNDNRGRGNNGRGGN